MKTFINNKNVEVEWWVEHPHRGGGGGTDDSLHCAKPHPRPCQCQKMLSRREASTPFCP